MTFLGMMEVKIVKVDREKLRSTNLTVKVKVDRENYDLILRILKRAVNVGDFVIIGDRVFRRVIGGFREANEEDLAELYASRL